MKEGRDLDALIAKKIMGLDPMRAGPDDTIFTVDRDWIMSGEYWYYEEGRGYDHIPPYSTDISAAWQVITEMERRGYWCEMRTPFMEPFKDDGYWAGFTPHGASGWNGTPDHWTHTESLSLSICLAALKAIEGEAQGNA